jgi:hypothetical protein
MAGRGGYTLPTPVVLKQIGASFMERQFYGKT